MDAYRDARAKGFDAWRLQVEGQVATPREFSLADLRQLQARTQITRHTCEEGWSAIGQWTGVLAGQGVRVVERPSNTHGRRLYRSVATDSVRASPVVGAPPAR